MYVEPSYQQIALERVGHETNVVEFFMKNVLDEEKSKEEGRTVFKAVEMVRIITPGDPSNIPVKLVDKTLRQRYAARYKLFLDKKPQHGEGGTPLSAWGQLPETRVAAMEFHNVHTVEQLAGLSDEGIGLLGMGTREEIARAKAWLAATKEAAPIAKLTAEALEKDKRIEALEKAMADLSARMPSEAKAEKRKGA